MAFSSKQAPVNLLQSGSLQEGFPTYPRSMEFAELVVYSCEKQSTDCVQGNAGPSLSSGHDVRLCVNRTLCTAEQRHWPRPPLSIVVWDLGCSGRWLVVVLTVWNLFQAGRFLLKLAQEHSIPFLPSPWTSYLLEVHCLTAKEGKKCVETILSCPISYDSSLFLDFSFQWFSPGMICWSL